MLQVFVTKFITKFVKSFRGAAVVGGLLTVAFQEALGLDAATTAEIVALILGFIYADTRRPKGGE